MAGYYACQLVVHARFAGGCLYNLLAAASPLTSDIEHPKSGLRSANGRIRRGEYLLLPRGSELLAFDVLESRFTELNSCHQDRRLAQQRTDEFEDPFL